MHALQSNCNTRYLHGHAGPNWYQKCVIRGSGSDMASTVWPSGLRRWLQAPVRKGVGSNPTAVTLRRPGLIRQAQASIVADAELGAARKNSNFSMLCPESIFCPAGVPPCWPSRAKKANAGKRQFSGSRIRRSQHAQLPTQPLLQSEKAALEENAREEESNPCMSPCPVS